MYSSVKNVLLKSGVSAHTRVYQTIKVQNIPIGAETNNDKQSPEIC